MSTADYTKEKDQSVGSHHEPIYDGEVVSTPNQALVRQLKGMLNQDSPTAAARLTLHDPQRGTLP